MRGDRPKEWLDLRKDKWFTPHARGSTLYVTTRFFVVPVYPACAGIDPHPLGHVNTHLRLPRMRGDRPLLKSRGRKDLWFTPHARGSTSHGANLRGLELVYPACAGIDRTQNQAV